MALFPIRRIELSPMEKSRLRVLFLAKHSGSGGQPSRVDGNHAPYHHEMLCTLREIGFHVETAESYDALHHRPDVDFVVTLLNRGRFVNSEMLAPLLAQRQAIPYLGASPILRGLGDDKHLSKTVASARGVPVTKWVIWRRGGVEPLQAFEAECYVVKPNASSASWGVEFLSDWTSAIHAASAIHASGHDALIEAWAPRFDVAVPVIGGPDGLPQLLVPMLFRNDDPLSFRSYEEKRGLVPTEALDDLEPIEVPSIVRMFHDLVERMLPEFWPCDYGRFEFRYDPWTGDCRFMEVNLSCNLWSRKSVSRAAAWMGMDHLPLVETILAHSMERQGVIAPAPVVQAA